jgi:formylglycine-generating enzyme
MPGSTPLEAEESPLHSKNVSQEDFNWNSNKKDGPYFEGPVRFVIKPDDPEREKFLFHNHMPSVTWCDNGDLIASWYNCARERGRETGLVASRFRMES